MHPTLTPVILTDLILKHIHAEEDKLRMFPPPPLLFLSVYNQGTLIQLPLILIFEMEAFCSWNGILGLEIKPGWVFNRPTSRLCCSLGKTRGSASGKSFLAEAVADTQRQRRASAASSPRATISEICASLNVSAAFLDCRG